MTKEPTKNNNRLNCNICGKITPVSKSETRVDDILVLFCKICGMGVIDPIPNDLNKFYADDYYNKIDSKVDGYSNYEDTAEHGTLWAAALLDALNLDRKNILDIGCANGYLLSKLSEKYKKFGIEMNRDAALEAQNSGVNIIANDLFDVKIEKSYENYFDIVTSIATFEHLADFRGGIETSLSFLKADGILLFEVPLISEVTSNNIWYSSSLEHVFYPTEAGLTFLFEKKLKVPFVGTSVYVEGFGSTYIGMVALNENVLQLHREKWLRIVDPDIQGQNKLERRAKALLYAIHAVQPLTKAVLGLADLKKSDLSKSLLTRVGYQWSNSFKESKAYKRATDYNASQASENSKLVEKQRQKLNNQKTEISELKQKHSELLIARDFHIDQSSRWKELFKLEEIKYKNVLHENTILKKKLYEKIKLKLVNYSKHLILNENRFKKIVRNTINIINNVSPTIARTLDNALRYIFIKLKNKVLYSYNPNSLKLTNSNSSISNFHYEAHPIDEPLVSIIIPCFNYGRYIKEAVNSALSQTFERIEIIVVDGGSTDGITPKIVSELKSERVQVFLRESRHRVGSNRNYGIEKAKGKYICCLDADDMLESSYIETAVFFAESYNYDVVSPSVQIFGDKDLSYDVAKTINLESLLRGNEVTTSSLFKKNLWKLVGGYKDYGTGSPETHIHEDWDFWIRIASNGARFIGLQGCKLFRYRSHGFESLSNSKGVRKIEDHLKDIKKLNSDILSDSAIELSVEANAKLVCTNMHWIKHTSPFQSNEKCLLVLLPWTVLGGAEKLLSNIFKYLRSNGWKIVIVTTLTPNPKDGDTHEWFLRATPYIYDLPKILSGMCEWEDYLKYLSHFHKVSRVLIAGSSFGYGQLENLKHYNSDMKIIDLLFNTVGHTSNNRFYSKFIDITIVENNEVKQWLLNNGETEDRVELIQSGVSINSSANINNSSFIGDINIQDKKVIGYSGRWSIEKDPILFIKIAKLVADHFDKDNKPVFIMTGAGNMESEIIKELSNSPSLNGLFHVIGEVENLEEVLSNYDLIVIPSKMDGRPVVAMEALALGVPVIASETGGLIELVQQNITGFLCPVGDINAFVENIVKVINDPEDLKLKKIAAKKFAKEYLDEEKMFKHYEDILLD